MACLLIVLFVCVNFPDVVRFLRSMELAQGLILLRRMARRGQAESRMGG
jgi:hypothetical protein